MCVLHTGATPRSQAYDHSTAPNYVAIEQEPGSYAHVVTEALEQLPYCSPSGIDAALTAGKWYKDVDGEYFFEPEGCRLRRLSGEAARSCLSGKHIAFIGDSVTRYEYLSLVHFLSKKVYMERYGRGASSEPSLVDQRDFNGWEDFFVNGSARIAAAVDAEAEEMCDCHRTAGGDMATAREHREFVLHQQGEAPVRVSYHFSYNYPSVEESMLHKIIRLFACGEQHPDVVVLNMVRYNCLHSPCCSPAHLNKCVQYASAGVVATSQGHWLHGDGSVQSKQDASWLHRLHGTVLRSASHIVASNDNLRATLFWQPTTPKLGFDEPMMAYSQAVDELETVVRQTIGQAARWQVLDVRSIAKASLNPQRLSFFWDGLHYLPVMYEQFNDLLLHMLCPAQ